MITLLVLAALPGAALSAVMVGAACLLLGVALVRDCWAGGAPIV